MKIYSDNAITKEQVDALAAQVDEKQTKEIAALRFEVRLLGMLYGFTALAFGVLYFTK